MSEWVTEELSSSDFGDARLDKRYRTLLQRFESKPSLSIPAACRGRAETEAAYRFFDNEKVTPEKILSPHWAASLERMRSQKLILLPQDTTQIDLTREREKIGGPLGEGYHWGFFAHVQLALTPERIALGVVHSQMWARDPQSLKKPQSQKKSTRRTTPIEQKESQRWLNGYRSACVLAEQLPDTQVISLGDSESDIYECFVEAGKADWIVRACHDRLLNGAEGLTRAKLLSAPVFGSWTIEVSRREAKTGNGRKRTLPREARTASVQARALSVELKPPRRPKGQTLPPTTVNVVLVQEMEPPAGEEPIEWILWTSLPIGKSSEVRQIVEYYCARWEIELLCKRWKSLDLVALLEGSTEVRQMFRVWSRLLMALVQHWLLVASSWGDATKSWVKVCRAIGDFADRLAERLCEGLDLEGMIARICQIIAKTCKRNKRSKSGTFELLNNVELLEFR